MLSYLNLHISLLPFLSLGEWNKEDINLNLNIWLLPFPHQVCDTEDIEIDIADLKLGNRYTFRVAAVNETGQSEWLEADGEVVAKDPWGK